MGVRSATMHAKTQRAPRTDRTVLVRVTSTQYRTLVRNDWHLDTRPRMMRKTKPFVQEQCTSDVLSDVKPMKAYNINPAHPMPAFCIAIIAAIAT